MDSRTVRAEVNMDWSKEVILVTGGDWLLREEVRGDHAPVIPAQKAYYFSAGMN